IRGKDQPAPRFRTRAKMLWTADGLHVAAEMDEPHVWGTLTEKNAIIFHDNDFEIFLDPDGDTLNYYEFEINALGTYWDLRLPKPYRDGGKAVDGWEIPGLKAAVHRDGTINDPRDTDRSWSVELAFPWSVLKEYTQRPAPPRDGDQWRVNFSRVQWDIEPAGVGYRKLPKRPEHNWVWSPQFAIDMHRPEMWGYVQFSRHTSGLAQFVPDVSWPARAWLYDVYYAQRAYRDKHKRYATTLADLNLAAPSDRNLSAGELVSRSASEYTASITLTTDYGRRVRWSVNQESAISAAAR
ncbi:MAG TPA: carbohydrate-binding family 9-like protein, partial [Vicinamibacterales bacterium]|nr:carbohydrate-binding family 9-like protein [Vicinamibacterales bacterium]